MIDKECLECKRYFVKSCNGIEDRGRKEITIENSCSGFLQLDFVIKVGQNYAKKQFNY